MIKQLCYDLFIIDWKAQHITKERELKSMRSYHRDVQMENVGGISYDDYVLEHGYDGELFPYFKEFLGTEYLDKAYMSELLEDEDLIKMYLDDLAVMKSDGKLVGTANSLGHGVFKLDIGIKYILKKTVGDHMFGGIPIPEDVQWAEVYDMDGNFIIKATLPCFKSVGLLEE